MRLILRVGQNRIELTGRLASAPLVRTTPSGTPILNFEVDCGDGRESLILGVVMAGGDAREVGARLSAGTIVTVTGVLRALAHGGSRRLGVDSVEVLASSIGEVLEGAGSLKS